MNTAEQINAETDSEFWAKTGYKPHQKLSASDPSDARMIPVWSAIHARLVDAFNRYGAVLPLPLVDLETDARFWANTGYKPGQPLDPTNQFDRMWTDTWSKIHDQVAREVAAGTTRWTYNSPAVADLIAKGNAASKAAAAQIAAASVARGAGDHAAADKHLADAHASIGEAQLATAQAAVHMPPPPGDVHPAAQAAAHEVLTFTMNGGQGTLTGAGAGVAPDDQVAIVQTALAPTRIAPSGLSASLDGTGTLPGGKGHNALIIGGICVALAGGVALANLAGKRTVVFRRARR